MKKILLATAVIGFAFAQVNAQTPAASSTTPQPAKNAQVADPALATPRTNQSAVKPAKPVQKVAPASVSNGKPATPKQGAHGRKTKRVVKENKDAAKPMAPGSNNKK